MRIRSGGQTGVDRAALDVALECDREIEGWCPKGRLAEDGTVPARYALAETPSARYDERTEWNVRDSDGTLILFETKIRPHSGTGFTRGVAKKLGRPLLCVDLLASPDPEAVRAWIRENRVESLNVAGPRESQAPGITGRAADFLRAVLRGTPA